MHMKNVQKILLAFFLITSSFNLVQAQINLGSLIKERLGGGEETTESSAAKPVIKNEQPVSFDMEVESFKKGKSKGKLYMKMTFSEWQTAMESRTEDMKTLVIFDNQKNTMTTVTNSGGELQGFTMKQPKVRVEMEEAMEGVQFSKTGRTKTINGLNCEEYRIETEDDVTMSWITDDYQIDYEKFITPLVNRVKKKPNGLSAGTYHDISGFPIESKTVSKDGKTEVLMKISNVKVDDIDRNIFNLEGVNIMSLGF